jgi:DNA repair exonuclease SbcCD ATPase subunit
MKADLNLTDDQAAKILPIITEDMKKRKDLWEQAKEQGHDSREAIKEQMEKLNQERDTKLAKYLNADQVTKLKQKREERKAGKHGHNHGGNRGGGHSGNDQGSGGE